MKAQPVIGQEVILSQAEAIQAFRGWISAELLTKQARWLGAESQRQKRTKTDLLAQALTLWVDRHPEACLTEARLFNVMREVIADLVLDYRDSAQASAEVYRIGRLEVKDDDVQAVRTGEHLAAGREQAWVVRIWAPTQLL